MFPTNQDKSNITFIALFTFKRSVEQNGKNRNPIFNIRSWLLIFNIGSCTSHGLSKTEPKILFFLTTHMSDSHISFLKNTWPYILKRFDIFSSADFLLYTTNSPEWIGDIFQKRLTVRTYQNPGYQEGANLAMKEFIEKEWYKGYDWIIRLNPDVIIKDDTWITEKMKNTIALILGVKPLIVKEI